MWLLRETHVDYQSFLITNFFLLQSRPWCSCLVMWWTHIEPQARSHPHSAGPHPSFTARSSCLHLRGNSSSLGTNVTILGQNHKHSSWHHFHYSQVNWWSSLTCQRNLMALVTNGYHIGSNGERFPCKCGYRDQAVKGVVGGAGTNWMKNMI